MSTDQEIKNRRHPVLSAKLEDFSLTRDAYIGGSVFKHHLIQYFRETFESFEGRQERAVYINYLKMIINVLTGFIIDNNNVIEINNLRLKEFNDTLVIRDFLVSFLQAPTFYLVDNHSYPEMLSVAEEGNLLPYVIEYPFDKIRDFSIGDDGKLTWILLDNSYLQNSDPFSKSEEIKLYTLITREFFQDFLIKDGNISRGEEMYHNLSAVPGVLESLISLVKSDSTTFEDIAHLSKAIYNTMSSADESLAASSYKTCFYPLGAGDDVPTAISDNGLGSLSVVPYNGTLSQRPFFDGPSTGEIKDYRELISFYRDEIFRQIGITEDSSRRFYDESGIAKSIEFRKTESVLRLIADHAEHLHIGILEAAATYLGTDSDFTVSYRRDFDKDSLENELTRLYDMAALPYTEVQKIAAKRIIRKVMTESTEEELRALDSAIDGAGNNNFDPKRVIVEENE